MPPKTLKTLRFGIEFELFTLDEKGYMVDGANRLIARVQKEHPSINIKKECGKNMIEIITLPHTEVSDAMLLSLEEFEKVAAIAAEEKLILYAYGTYPGEFTPNLQKEHRYTIQGKILGKKRFLISGRCIGLHFHFSLPWGVFDTKNKVTKLSTKSRNLQSMANCYNLCIAMDPALTTFSQSSPFYQGDRLGKDARMIVYRGGKHLHYAKGLYGQFPKFGALQNYKKTGNEIHQGIVDRFNALEKIFKRLGYKISSFLRRDSILDSAWNPIKITPHGTIEIRGTDMNHPDVIIALAVLLKYIIKIVQEKHIDIVVSEEAIAKPFHFNGKRILIPPDHHVIQHLQHLAAYKGLASPELHLYCTALLKLGKKVMPKDRHSLLIPLQTFLRTRQTASDRIVGEALKVTKGKKKLTHEQAAALALSLSKDLYMEIQVTKKRLKSKSFSRSQ